MNRFVVACAYLACAMGAPTVPLATTGYAGLGAGPPVVQNRVEYGVVGQRTVQTGLASVVAGHQYAVAGQETIPQPATSYVAGAPQNLVETRALPPPAIPAAPAPYAAIPPAPRNL